MGFYLLPLILGEKVAQLTFRRRWITAVIFSEASQSVVTSRCSPLNQAVPTSVAILVGNTSAALTDVWQKQTFLLALAFLLIP